MNPRVHPELKTNGGVSTECCMNKDGQTQASCFIALSYIVGIGIFYFLFLQELF